MIKPRDIPDFVKEVSKNLKKSGFEAYLVGGCVRDLLIKREPKDWDITTNATPEEIQNIFPDTFYENSYGTVGVIDRNEEGGANTVVEVTPYRKEGGYSDFRR